jgi:hypothetical protein
MKILMIAVLVGACAVQQDEDVSSTAQQICQDDPDTCPGGHPITIAAAKSMTDSFEYGKLVSAGDASPIPATECSQLGGSVIQCHSSDWVDMYHFVESSCDFWVLSGDVYCGATLCSYQPNVYGGYDKVCTAI